MKQVNKHFLGWLVYSLVIFLLFLSFTDSYTALAHIASFVGTQIIAFYVNLYLLIPKLYQRHQYAFFGLSNFILIVVSSILNGIIEHALPGVHHSEESSIKGAEKVVDIEPLLAHSMPCLLAIFFAFLLFAYWQRKAQEEKELSIITAEKNFLIQQINPHFLFNTLNNIYSLTINNDPKGSQAILQLSKMLDYSLYGNKSETVSLQKEVQYIQNFIELFKLKDDQFDNISFAYTIVNTEDQIAPMLLLPFVENAFKHGNIEDTTFGKITIWLQSNEKEIEFKCANTYLKDKKVDHVGGIGISNVKRRLQLLYPQQHQLAIDIKHDIYSVSLKLLKNEI